MKLQWKLKHAWGIIKRWLVSWRIANNEKIKLKQQTDQIAVLEFYNKSTVHDSMILVHKIRKPSNKENEVL